MIDTTTDQAADVAGTVQQAVVAVAVQVNEGAGFGGGVGRDRRVRIG